MEPVEPMTLMGDTHWDRIFDYRGQTGLDGFRVTSRACRELVDRHPIWSHWIWRDFGVQGSGRAEYQDLVARKCQLLSGRRGFVSDGGIAPTMAPGSQPEAPLPQPHLFTLGDRQWLLTLTRTDHLRSNPLVNQGLPIGLGNGTLITVKEIGDQLHAPIETEIDASCCTGVRGVALGGQPFVVSWGGNRLACLNLADWSLVETAPVWAAGDSLVGATFRGQEMIVTTKAGDLWRLDPRLPAEAVRLHSLGPNALDVVTVGNSIVQVCAPSILWIIPPNDAPRQIDLEPLQADAIELSSRIGGFTDFGPGTILAALEVKGQLMVELPLAYYLVDIEQGAVVRRHPKSDLRAEGRPMFMKMRFPLYARSHLQQSTLSVIDTPLLATLRQSSLVVWMPPQRQSWTIHLDPPCHPNRLWHALGRSGATDTCLQLCQDCGQVRVYSFAPALTEPADPQAWDFSEATHFFDMTDGHLRNLPPPRNH